MIKGIEMLNKTAITEPGKTTLIVFFIAAVVFIISFILVIHLGANDNVIGIVISSVLFFTSLIVMVGCKFIEQPTGRYRYEVTINKDVSIQEVYEKYNVIEQDGKKWILEDKE